MKGFIEEYGKIIVVIILTLLMLGFGQTGLAKPLQNSLLKSTGMITNAHNKFDEVTKEPETVTPGASIDIEGVKYVVLEEHGNNQALVITASSIGDRVFQPGNRSDGQDLNIYEGSHIDDYLENTWYKGLSAKMQSAIQTTDIKQASYANYRDPDSKQETGFNGEVYNTISRHVFLPSVSEIGKAVDLKNPDKVKAFIKNISNNNSVFDDSIWTRDICLGYGGNVEYLDDYSGQLGRHPVYNSFGTRPAFVIDLSKVDYKVTGHTDYK